jgi:hypothetical protein
MPSKKHNVFIDSSEIRKLILENPDLPIVFKAGSEEDLYAFPCYYAKKISAKIGEVLDADVPFNTTYVYDDKKEFINDVVDYVETEYGEVTGDNAEEKFEYTVKSFDIVKEFESHWRKAIIITATL